MRRHRLLIAPFTMGAVQTHLATNLDLITILTNVLQPVAMHS